MTATLPPPPPSAACSDRAAMLRTILEYPEDDSPRLVFADFLDEAGEHERAEFIRAGIADARHYTWSFDALARCWPFFAVPSEWNVASVLIHGGFISEVRLPCAAFMSHAASIFAAHPVTGFVSMVQMECAAFMQHAASIFQAHPVTRVVLVDCRPYFDVGLEVVSWEWYVKPPSPRLSPSLSMAEASLPREIYPTGKWRHPSESAALDALSKAAVAYGRIIAGLAPLPD